MIYSHKDFSKTYHIKKSHHYVRWYEMIPLIHWNVKKVYFEINFDPSCYWFPPRNEDDKDKNKLFGLGYGFNHHKNSIRLAWVPNFEKPKHIDIFSYSYDGSKKEILKMFIKTVEVGKTFKGNITGLQQDTYQIQFAKDTPIQIPNNSKDKKWGFYLRPYIGGNNTAIRNMKITINWLSLKYHG